MNINIDYQMRTPLYLQIVLEVEKQVALNILEVGTQIPSIRELACNLGINPNTVKKAYDILESKGVITSYSTKGTFIKDEGGSVRKIKQEEILEEIKEKMRELESYGLAKEEIIEKLKN